MVLHTDRTRETNKKPSPWNKNQQLFKFWGIAIFLMACVTFAQVRLDNDVLQFDPVLQGEMEQWQIVAPPTSLPEAFYLDEDDKEHLLEDIKGQWTLINFWATWCPACIVELPEFQALQDQLGGQDFKVIALNMDNGMKDNRLQAFAKKYSIEGIIGYRAQGRSIHKALGIRGLPTTILLDPKAVLRGVYLGEADWASPDAIHFVKSFLDQDYSLDVSSGTASNKSATNP